MKYFSLTIFLFLTLSIQMVWAGRAPVQSLATAPYRAALVLDAQTGNTLFSINADTVIYPASVLKLMVLLVTLDHVNQGIIHLDDMVHVTREAAKMGGSQVYLDPREQFSVDDMLYALMIQSANDAAVALATHIGGSKERFVELMNTKAAELGMTNTTFHSVHGLPPATGQQVDVSTARDFGKLALALVKLPEVFKYTGTQTKDFRNGKFVMRNHNHLLGKVTGCDGLKTGYFRAAGFSIAATAKRGDQRVITLVMGSSERKVRDAKTTELLARGFALLKDKQQQKPQNKKVESANHPVSKAQPQPPTSASPLPQPKMSNWILTGVEILSVLAICGVAFRLWKNRRKKNRFRH